MRMTASWFGLPYGPPNTRSQRTLCASQTGSAFDHLGPFDPRLKRRAQDRQGRFALLCSALRASLTAPARGAGEKSGRNEGMPAPAEQRNGGNDAGVLTSRSPYKRHVSGALDGPFVVLLEQERADEAENGVIVGEDADGLRRLLGEGGGDEGGDDTAAALAGMRQHIAHEMNPATLPCGAENLGDGRLEAFVRIGDDELDAAQSAPGQLAQELGPDRLGLRGADLHAQHLAPAV